MAFASRITSRNSKPYAELLSHMSIESLFSDKIIVITGGTGSFGKKCAQILLSDARPRKIIILSRDELKQHEMRQWLPDTGDSPVRYFVGDVRDRERMYRAFDGVDIVIHAAALKQVPSC